MKGDNHVATEEGRGTTVAGHVSVGIQEIIDKPEPVPIDTDFICDCRECDRPACAGEGPFAEHEGKRFCVLHYPHDNKLEAFRAALKKKLDVKDFNFSGVWFPETVSFRGVQFHADASFAKATFSEDVDFGMATFDADAEFRDATFCKNADFSWTTFRAITYFRGASFSAITIFRNATFCALTYFRDATFNAYIDMRGATFKSYVRFEGSDTQRNLGKAPQLDLQFVRIENPDHFSFHSLNLHPNWFINVDPRKFEFSDVEWNYGLQESLDRSQDRVIAMHRLLAITYRRLAVNAEENHRYGEASRFRYNAFEIRRIESFVGFVPWRLDWWYWLVSGYGESVGRAFIVFIVLIALFAYGYTKVGFKQDAKSSPATSSTAVSTAQIQTEFNNKTPDTRGKPLGKIDALMYSAYVSILQKPDPSPLTSAAKTLVWMEMVLGPVQAALLALAIRRRFMR